MSKAAKMPPYFLNNYGGNGHLIKRLNNIRLGRHYTTQGFEYEMPKFLQVPRVLKKRKLEGVKQGRLTIFEC